MSYKLYTDKINKFTCTVQVDGTSLGNSKVRLVIESEGINYMFDGKIYEGGNCEVIVPKTKNFLNENTKGIVRLEVIADDVFFEPWNSEYVVETTKKVNVVVQEQIEEKPKMIVNVKQQEIVKPQIKEEKKQIQPSNRIKHNSQLSKGDIMKLLKNK